MNDLIDAIKDIDIPYTDADESCSLLKADGKVEPYFEKAYKQVLSQNKEPVKGYVVEIPKNTSNIIIRPATQIEVIAGKYEMPNAIIEHYPSLESAVAYAKGLDSDIQYSGLSEAEQTMASYYESKEPTPVKQKHIDRTSDITH